MGNANAFYKGAQWVEDAATAKRQAASDAWESEKKDRLRQDWQDQDIARTGLATMIDGAVKTGSTREAIDPYAIIGVTPQQEQVQPVVDSQQAYNARQGFETAPSQQATTQPAGAPTLANQAPKPAPYLDSQKQLINQRFAMAKAIGGKEGATMAMEAQKELHTLRLKEDSLRISDAVTNLRPQEYEKLMATVTADKGNRYEASVDKNTGVTTLKLGSAKVQMSREQAGQYFAAKHRLKNGDFSAMTDLEAIDKGLAAQVASEYTRLQTEATEKNKFALENLKSGNNIKETGVRLDGERSNAAHRIGLEQQAPVTLSEGQQRMVPQRQKDGSITYVTAASVPAKPNAANPTSARMLKLTIDTLGDTNRVSGQKIGNQKALDIATAAEMLVNSGMGELEAINKAAADLAIKGVK